MDRKVLLNWQSLDRIGVYDDDFDKFLRTARGCQIQETLKTAANSRAAGPADKSWLLTNTLVHTINVNFGVQKLQYGYAVRAVLPSPTTVR
ncbi:MAG: hypothetical protein OXI87_01100 [Albidovulum sp.]|nr:hypothetical protein [Albidovulum sp.]